MVAFRYSAWDGSQNPFEIDPDEVMEQLSDDLMRDSNLPRALQRLMQRGMQNKNGQKMDGYRDLMERLRRRKKEMTEKYDLGSVLNDIEKKLKDIIDTEKKGVERKVQEGRKQAEGDPTREPLQKMMESMAAKRQQALDNLPPEPAGQIKELGEYDFMDADARQKFQELMDQLKQKMMEQYTQNMKSSMQGMTPQDMQAMREMVQDLNKMLQSKMQGEPTDQQFKDFMDKWGPTFGNNPPKDLDELIDQFQEHINQAQSLMDSMPEDARRQMRELMESLMDKDTMRDFAQMAALMEYLNPTDALRKQYDFSGQDQISLDQAMKLMESMQQMDQMESQLKGINTPADLDKIDEAKLAELLGEEGRRSWEQLKELLKRLEAAGYIKRDGDKIELTPRGMRRIGQKAIRDIFSRLKKDRLGNHETRFRGTGGEYNGETKPWEFGDEFAVDLQRSLMNTVLREGIGTPLRMDINDFEIQRSEHTSQAATCLLIDRSRSMGYYGSWAAAKKVTIALHTLIRTQYPRDSLYIIGFSDAAVRFHDEDLPEMNWDTRVSGTNMHHAFMMARGLLSKHKGSTRQIIMITDGEPTAHLEHGVPYFSYPPSHRTIQETLKEARRLALEGVTINTFMLENNFQLMEFVSLITKVNGGRAFYSTPEKLGEYVLVDYLTGRRKHVA